MIKTSQAELATSDTSRYIRRLCKHWSHKFEVSFDDSKGTINFGDSNCTLTATPNRLDIFVTAHSDSLKELQDVVINHLKRFTAPDEDMNLEWKILNTEM